MMIDRIRHLAAAESSYVIGVRRAIHQNPELSFHEEKTSAFLRGELEKMGFEVSSYAGNGLMAMLKPVNKNEKVIALRADIDALPVKELTGASYCSKNEGIMHACGHDAHAAMLLGAAKILSEIKDEIHGNIKFIFQPAEEKLPGGALKMIEEGILENPYVLHVVGQHVYPELPAGKAGFCAENYMASTDEIYITVIGKGGHAAIPWKLTDPVVIAAQLITALQQVVSRNAPALFPSVLSFGKVIADGATNVIPDEVIIEGTFRSFNETFRSEAHQNIKRITKSVVEGLGGKAKIEIRRGYPVLYNHPALTYALKKLAGDYLGEENVVDLPQRMSAEDFSYFSQQRPSVFYRLGTGFPDKENHPLHSSYFDINEDALLTGTGLFAWLTVNLLENVHD